jgi:hypothetical protein
MMKKRLAAIAAVGAISIAAGVGAPAAFGSNSWHGVGPDASRYWAVGPSDAGSTGLSRVCDAHITNYGYSYGRCNSV